MFKTYSSLSSLVITSRWFATSRLVAPVSVRLVYYIEFLKYHDNFTKWKHFHRSPVDSPHKGQWHWALILSLACAWTNGWTNNRDTGNLRCHHAHYDTAVMILPHINKLHLTSSYTYSIVLPYIIDIDDMKSIWKLRSIIDMDFSILIYRTSQASHRKQRFHYDGKIF